MLTSCLSSFALLHRFPAMQVRDQRFAALNQQKLATKWAAPLSCHWSPDLLASAHAKQQRHPAHAVPIDAASENTHNDGGAAHNDRYLRAGSVAKALYLRHGSTANTKKGGGGRSPAASATTPAPEVGLTDGLGWTLEAVAGAGRGASLRVLFVDWIAPEVRCKKVQRESRRHVPVVASRCLYYSFTLFTGWVQRIAVEPTLILTNQLTSAHIVFIFIITFLIRV